MSYPYGRPGGQSGSGDPRVWVPLVVTRDRLLFSRPGRRRRIRSRLNTTRPNHKERHANNQRSNN